ncbi:hypothetical protein [Amycolatopsis samaneae]|uniref:Uncharacterized protein n=1 Tax=Amycolatopsis samaneae TaxID=664691 RepID=A0ABW5GR51_9PSEU
MPPPPVATPPAGTLGTCGVVDELGGVDGEEVVVGEVGFVVGPVVGPEVGPVVTVVPGVEGTVVGGAAADGVANSSPLSRPIPAAAASFGENSIMTISFWDENGFR